MSRNHPPRPDVASKSEAEAVATLEAELADFMAQQAACAAKIKELRSSENLSAGIVHAQEIFHLQQDKLRLQVEMDCRRNAINRIRLFGLPDQPRGTAS
ncbi:hypothetical protein [Desulfonatronum thioautotrophicum]|uniref:hypothetical protein n=1 Tax=Desulfonatronum thioautotrophicum TaxID=617001 RepID=UPI0005EACEAC|nr:hypothetical protein [Desulfonatronum thioautotrophicum]